jgi:hypothetical protein
LTSSAKTMPSGFVEKRQAFVGLPREPHAPAAYDIAEVAAFQAVARGVATGHQQQMVIQWLLYASGKNGISYVPGDTHATAFNEGRRFLGQQIDLLLKLNTASLKD